ncbi:helix-turn-helix transcriptional regulator [Scrofimicrobium sp. R131]|uniref:MarR family transcriptional regulator n=1 Tax=Scrofimicrobium appendicitidis TaxID=3079930 RepID=A0AAU7V4V2_9ACTO
MAGLTPTQHQVLQELAKSPDPLRVEELAQRLSLHGNTIRGVLAQLLKLDLVSRRAEETEKRGRPSWLYEARAAADAQLVMEGFASLMYALTEQLERTSPDPVEAARKLGAHWGSQILEDQQVPDHQAMREALQAEYPVHITKLRLLMSRLGFQATGSEDDHVIELHQCPLVDNREDAEPSLICEIHHGMIQQVVSSTSNGRLSAKLCPFSGTGYCGVEFQET